MALALQDTDTKRTGDLPHNLPRRHVAFPAALWEHVPIIRKMTSLTACQSSCADWQHVLIGAVFNRSYGDGSGHSGGNRSHLQPTRLCVCGNLCSEHSCLLAPHQTPEGQDRYAAL